MLHGEEIPQPCIMHLRILTVPTGCQSRCLCFAVGRTACDAHTVRLNHIGANDFKRCGAIELPDLGGRMNWCSTEVALGQTRVGCSAVRAS